LGHNSLSLGLNRVYNLFYPIFSIRKYQKSLKLWITKTNSYEYRFYPKLSQDYNLFLFVRKYFTAFYIYINIVLYYHILYYIYVNYIFNYIYRLISQKLQHINTFFFWIMTKLKIYTLMKYLFDYIYSLRSSNLLIFLSHWTIDKTRIRNPILAKRLNFSFQKAHSALHWVMDLRIGKFTSSNQCESWRKFIQYT